LEDLRKEIEIISQNHEREVDRKDAIIQVRGMQGQGGLHALLGQAVGTIVEGRCGGERVGPGEMRPAGGTGSMRLYVGGGWGLGK
jgi:hypothetical protein